jgi:ABC-2 type transport system permease protein
MSSRRILTLLGKEIRLGATNIFLAYAIVFPILFSLLVGLVFGDLFSGKPRLGIYAAGETQVIQRLTAKESLLVRVYMSEDALRDDVKRGAVELGLILPAGFDQAVQNGEATTLTSLRWGEASLRDLVLIDTTFAKVLVDMAGISTPVQVEATPLGNVPTASWSERLLPLLVIMAVLLGGLVVPSTSLIDEKQSRTLIAVTTTPASLLEIYTAKVLLGVLIGFFTGWATLFLNDAFAGQAALLLGVLGLGALASSLLGALLGTVTKDMDTFIAVVKALGILLYAPGILALIPQVPEWVAKIFPTYYMVDPVIQISQKGAGLSELAGELAILLAFVATLLLALVFVAERQKEKIALAG